MTGIVTGITAASVQIDNQDVGGTGWLVLIQKEADLKYSGRRLYHREHLMQQPCHANLHLPRRDRRSVYRKPGQTHGQLFSLYSRERRPKRIARAILNAGNCGWLRVDVHRERICVHGAVDSTS